MNKIHTKANIQIQSLKNYGGKNNLIV